jgi:GT2 family glycosyltransferase
VRVGIVSWNSARHLGACLDSLPAALGPHAAEVVVVDNASGDDSVAVAQRRPGVRTLRNTVNVGYAAAMDRALAPPHPAVLVALNPDTVAPPGSLAALVDVLLGDPAIGLVAPRLRDPSGREQFNAYRFPSAATVAAEHLFWPEPPPGTLRRRVWGPLPERGCLEVDWASGAVHVIRSAALAGAPAYSRRWFIYNEDLELCWRLRRGGWRRVVADVDVVHVGNASGVQRWGNDPSRWTIAGVYDWYATVHGPGAARVWAAANAVSASCHVATLAARSFAGERMDRRTRALQLWRQLPLHLAALRHGPPPPVGPPPEDGSPWVLPDDPWATTPPRRRRRASPAPSAPS